MGQLFVEGHGLFLGLGLFVGLMHMSILHFHPFSLDAALLPISFVAMCQQLLVNALEDIPFSVLFLELVLGLFLAPDGDKIPG